MTGAELEAAKAAATACRNDLKAHDHTGEGKGFALRLPNGRRTRAKEDITFLAAARGIVLALVAEVRHLQDMVKNLSDGIVKEKDGREETESQLRQKVDDLGSALHKAKAEVRDLRGEVATREEELGRLKGEIAILSEQLDAAEKKASEAGEAESVTQE